MAPAVLIVVIVAALLALAAGVAWFLGYPVTGLERLRASGTEAGERAADLTADFLDWVRIGR